MERLQKVIASSGLCSRRKAEELIIDGRVKVNGVICNTLGSQVNMDDLIMVDDKLLEIEKKVYYLLNKPKNCITTVSDDHGRITVMDYMKGIPYRVFPVGRLDYDTTGALLFTNDGELSNHLMHPRYEVNKTYQATCLGKLTSKDMTKLENGIFLDDGFIKAISARVIDYCHNTNTTFVEIKVSEGRKHMIKNMISYLGSQVIKLHRYEIAGITTENLEIGKYRELTDKEIKCLKEYKVL